jgi:putative hemolysin
MIGAAEQFSRRLVVPAPGDPRRARLLARRCGSQAIDDAAGGLEVVLAQEHDELLAAVAGERVAWAQLRAPRRGRLL